MINQDVLDYIKKELQQGISQEQIKGALIGSGWQIQDINEAFNVLNNESMTVNSHVPKPQFTTVFPDVIDILKETWFLYKKQIRVFLGITIIPILIFLITTIIVFFSVRHLEARDLFEKFMTNQIGFLAGSIALGVALIFIILISQIWSQVALLYAIKESKEGIGVIEAYRKSWRKILSYGWIYILAGIIIMGGLLFFIIPGIIFMVWFSLALFILINEDEKGMNALLKSREYVKEQWWGVLWRFFFIGFLSTMALFPLSFILALVPFGIYFVNILFITPFTIVYGFLVYKNLRDFKGEIAFKPTLNQKLKFICIGIIGMLIPTILFSIGIFNFINRADSVKEQARDTQRIVDIQTIQTQLSLYYLQHEQYPSSLNELPEEFLNIPVDPKTNLPYQYERRDYTNYELCAQLERTERKCVSS